MRTRLITIAFGFLVCARLPALEADLIFHHGKIVTVDDKFAIVEALAVKDGRILQTGSNESIQSLKGPRTQTVDLGGKTMIPGLIDSHVHPGAAMVEFDHPLPEMETIADVLKFIKARAQVVKAGDWINVRQVFITRLQEQRYPTREELDQAAPENPVDFSTGPDAMLNSLALKLCGIDRNFKVTDGGSGHLERDPASGEPTGMLRGLSRFVKSTSPDKHPTDQDVYEGTLRLFKDYNSVGITAIADRDASPDYIEHYQKMRAAGDLSVRIAVSYGVSYLGRLDQIQARIRKIAEHPLRQKDPLLRIIGIKMYLDGGMLTGSAYMREPWGVSTMYGITDPTYRGVLNIPPDRLLPIVKTTVEAGLQFTAHSVGDGAVHNLLAAYEEVNQTTPVRPTRSCITHSNFMSQEDVEKAARLGVAEDIQPAWLYLDARTLQNQFGYDRLRYFQPLHSIFKAGGIAGGGSDHMQKIGSLRSVNPYNPFLGMATTVTRKARWYNGRLHPEEALTREEALRFYTRNNAYILFLDDEVGTLEAGKRADLAILDRDILTCPEDDIKDTQVLKTYLNGKVVYERP